MASEVQKPLAKMEFLLVYGWLAIVSLEPWRRSKESKMLQGVPKPTLINQSGEPAAAAVDTAPMRKLCPLRDF